MEAADLVSPNLNNPDGIKKTFKPYKKDIAFDEEGYPIWERDEDGNITDATHWIASFLATENASEGKPSKEMLDYFSAGMTGILWIRTKNPYHPQTIEADKNKVVATNWDAFAVGDAVNLAAVIAAIS